MAKFFFDGHMGRGALQRILKQMANHLAAAIFPQKRDVLPVQLNSALIHVEITGNRAKHGGFACAVGTNDRGKFACVQMKAQIVQCRFLIDGTRR